MINNHCRVRDRVYQTMAPRQQNKQNNMIVLCTALLLASLLPLIVCNPLARLNICPVDTGDRLTAAMNLAAENLATSKQLYTFYAELETELLESRMQPEPRQKVLQQILEFKRAMLSQKICAEDRVSDIDLLIKDYNKPLDALVDDQSNPYDYPPPSKPPTIDICTRIDHSIKGVEEESMTLEELGNIHYSPFMFCCENHLETECLNWLWRSLLQNKKFIVTSAWQ